MSRRGPTQERRGAAARFRARHKAGVEPLTGEHHSYVWARLQQRANDTQQPRDVLHSRVSTHIRHDRHVGGNAQLPTERARNRRAPQAFDIDPVGHERDAGGRELARVHHQLAATLRVDEHTIRLANQAGERQATQRAGRQVAVSNAADDPGSARSRQNRVSAREPVTAWITSAACSRSSRWSARQAADIEPADAGHDSERGYPNARTASP